MNEQTTTTSTGTTKFCKHCGQQIASAAVVCPHCGCLVEEIQKESAAPQQIVINNTNTNMNTNTNTNVNANGKGARAKNKWVAICLCIFLGVFGGHKFYEGKIGMGILYLLTVGLFGFGVIIDFIVLLFKPNPYYV